MDELDSRSRDSSTQAGITTHDIMGAGLVYVVLVMLVMMLMFMILRLMMPGH